MEKPDIPKKQEKPDKPAKPEKPEPRWIAFAFKARAEQVERMKDVAYWDRKEIRQVFSEAMELYLQNRKVKPRPKAKDE